jgi:hypothetical protein
VNAETILVLLIGGIGLIFTGLAWLVSWLTWRHNTEKTRDIYAGTHSIAYREHVWFLHERELTVIEIENILRQETYRPGLPVSQGNAYQGLKRLTPARGRMNGSGVTATK